MTNRTTWLVDNRVVYTQIVGEATYDDIMNMLEEFKAYHQAGQEPLHWIHDRRQLIKPYVSLKGAQEVINAMSSIQGWMLFLSGPSDNTVLNFATSILTQRLGVRTRMPFSDYTSLWQFLVERDMTLPTEPPPLPNLFSQEELQNALASLT